jgi:hypothetical protein
MAKYRILEENGKFYPQYELDGKWRFFIHATGHGMIAAYKLESAIKFLDIESKKLPKQIIHEYKPKEDER